MQFHKFVKLSGTLHSTIFQTFLHDLTHNHDTLPTGPLCADEPTYTPEQPSIWTQYRPVDITLYDLLYGKKDYKNVDFYLTLLAGSPSPPSVDRTTYPYTYRPLHTSIYGNSRNRVARMY